MNKGVKRKYVKPAMKYNIAYHSFEPDIQKTKKQLKNKMEKRGQTGIFFQILRWMLLLIAILLIFLLIKK